MKKLIFLALPAVFFAACQKAKITPAISVSPSTPPSITYAATNNLTVGTPVTISPTNTGGTVPATVYGQVTTVAGSTSAASGFVNSTGKSALFNNLQGIVGDASGNLYVADAYNNAIRKISPAGVVTTFAGSATGVPGNADGTGTSALFSWPDGVTIDASGNLFVADYTNNEIREITPVGVVTTFYKSTTLFGPEGMCFDGSGNLIVAAADPSLIIKISPAGVATTFAGNYIGYDNGTGTAAHFNTSSDVKMDASGNIIVADYLNNAIRKITPAGVVTTIAGSLIGGNAGGFAGGVGTTAEFQNASGIALGAGGVIYVADFGNHDIRAIMPDGTVMLVAGSSIQVPGNQDGIGTAAQFNLPDYIYIDNTGTGYITESGGNRVRKIVLTGYSLSGILPTGLTFDPTTGIISGTPTAASPATNYIITAYNTKGISSSTITIAVN